MEGTMPNSRHFGLYGHQLDSSGKTVWRKGNHWGWIPDSDKSTCFQHKRRLPAAIDAGFTTFWGCRSASFLPRRLNLPGAENIEKWTISSQPTLVIVTAILNDEAVLLADINPPIPCLMAIYDAMQRMLSDLVEDTRLECRIESNRVIQIRYNTYRARNYRRQEEVIWEWPGRRLGQGGFGTVFVQERLLGDQEERRVVKSIDKGVPFDADQIEYRQEIEAMAKFSHEKVNTAEVVVLGSWISKADRCATRRFEHIVSTALRTISREV